MQNQPTPPKRLLRRLSVLDRLQISNTELYRRIRLGTFPKSIRLGPNSIAFLESDIDAYIQKLIQETAK
jgi:prophage regulatory protein